MSADLYAFPRAVVDVTGLHQTSCLLFLAHRRRLNQRRRTTSRSELVPEAIWTLPPRHLRAVMDNSHSQSRVGQRCYKSHCNLAAKS